MFVGIDGSAEGLRSLPGSQEVGRRKKKPYKDVDLRSQFLFAFSRILSRFSRSIATANNHWIRLGIQ